MIAHWQAAAPPQDPPAFAALEWPGDVRDAPAPAWPWGLALALAGVLAVVLWRFARRAAPSAAPSGAPVPTALAKLQALGLPAEPAAFAAFYQELKALVRLHCRERFGLRAEVATSEELVRSLPQRAELPPCLRACDLVLFAARAPAVREAAADRAAAIAFAMANGDHHDGVVQGSGAA